VVHHDLVVVVVVEEEEEEEEEVEILVEAEDLGLLMMFGVVCPMRFQVLMLAECGPCNRR
jgi:hypothetical protein